MTHHTHNGTPARDVTVGVVANPASGRDIRRLVAQASVFPAAEKANMIQRMLTAFGSVDVRRALVSTDLGGISAAVLRAVRKHTDTHDPPWPDVEFCDTTELTDTADDTRSAIRHMIADGASVIVCLGGDGTARVAADACGDVPLLPVSTGTNNAFPQLREATVAGLAAGLLAAGTLTYGIRRTTALEVRTGSRRELALVDVAVSSERHVGSRALWQPETLTELYCTFAEPDGIGMSSVAGQLCPSPRATTDGVQLALRPPHEARHVVHAPIAPGLVLPVGVGSWEPLAPGRSVHIGSGPGVVAVDGEREIELGADTRATVTLRDDGPRCVDVTATLTEASARGLLRSPTNQPSDATAMAASPR